MRFRLLALLLLLAALPAGARADSLVLTSVRDNTLFQDANGDTSNGAGPAMFIGRNAQAGRIRRAVLAFDVRADLFPTGSVIDSVRLDLRLTNNMDSSPRTASLHRVLADWGEAGSSSSGGTGAPAEAGDATWLHTFYPGSQWAAVGGDYAATPTAAITVHMEGPYEWKSDGMANDVRAWVAQSAGNFGWILIGDESVPGTARRFDTRESPTVEFRPHLIVYYSPSVPAARRTWGNVRGGYR